MLLHFFLGGGDLSKVTLQLLGVQTMPDSRFVRGKVCGAELPCDQEFLHFPLKKGFNVTLV